MSNLDHFYANIRSDFRAVGTCGGNSCESKWQEYWSFYLINGPWQLAEAETFWHLIQNSAESPPGDSGR